MWHPLLEVRVRAALRRRRAITGLLCVCLRPSLSGDRVKQRHGNSLSRLLESCYQILDLPEISFLHTRSGLKHEREREREEVEVQRIQSISPSPHQNPSGEMKRMGQSRLEMSSRRFYLIKRHQIRCQWRQ